MRFRWIMNLQRIDKNRMESHSENRSGMSNKEIASELALSEGTVRNYLSSVLSKLELRDRTQLAIWAVQTGAVNRYIGE